MNVEEMIKYVMKMKGYDGLIYPSRLSPCSCDIDNLIPCDCYPALCEAAYKHRHSKKDMFAMSFRPRSNPISDEEIEAAQEIPDYVAL